MRPIVLYLLLLVFMTSCYKTDVAVDQVISNLIATPDTVDADGISIVTITAMPNSKSDSSRRNILLKASNGNFVGAKDSSITIRADFSTGPLLAKAIFIVPDTPGI